MDVIGRVGGLVVAGVVTLGLSGCMMFMTREDGQNMQSELDALKKKNANLEAQISKNSLDETAQVKTLREQVDQATNGLTRAANLGQDVDKLKQDNAASIGRLEVIEKRSADNELTVQGLSKSFTDFRAVSDTKLEQLTNATTTAKAPPIPETPDGVYGEARKRYDAKQWNDARRLFDAFIARYSSDPRAATAQYLIGDSYFEEGKFANAIGAFSKVIDNYSKSESVPDAMYKNGLAFYSLKYCGDAKIYFTELLRRYPKTDWKKDAGEQLKKLVKDAKNKSVCQS